MSAPTPADASKKRERENVPEAKGAEAKNTPMNYDVFEEEFAKLLERIQQNDATLTTIDWENRGLNLAGVNALASALLKSTTVQVLKLGYNKFGDEAAGVLGSLFLQSGAGVKPPIKEVYLPDSNFTAKGVATIAHALLLNNTVVHFDISRNRPEKEGCIALGKLLMARSGDHPSGAPIQVLDLCMSNLTPEALQGMLDGLSANTTVHTLILHNNKLMDAGFAALLEALKKNHFVSRLDVAVNGLTDVSCDALAAVIRGRTALSTLELCSNSITQKGTAALAEAVANNHTINHLDLINNDVGAEGKKALLDMLRKNSFITFLNFGTIDDEVNSLIERNKIYAVRMMFMRGKFTKGGVLQRSFFSDPLFDHNLLRVVFAYVHDDKLLKAPAAAAAAAAPAK